VGQNPALCAPSRYCEPDREEGVLMAYLIIGLIIVFVVIWAAYMSKTHNDPNRKVKFEKARYRGGSVRRYARAGRTIVQTDEQRSELIMNNRVRYDPSIDRLDPRHPEYKNRVTDEVSPSAEDE
jgi:hypothetical protein